MGLTEKDTAHIFRAFGDENRIRILQLLQKGEMCAFMLLQALEISQPTLSHHMKILCEAGVVTARREGKRTIYALSHSDITAAVSYLQQLVDIES